MNEKATTGLKKRRRTRATPVKVAQGQLVKHHYLTMGHHRLSVFQPTVSRFDGLEWSQTNRPIIEQQLLKDGAILFRDFQIDSVSKFENLVQSFSSELIRYGEKSSPRTQLSQGVYTSTDHPADQPILLHNEQSYTLNWPMKICFCCLQPAAEMGRTPIADSRKIFQRLDAQIIEAFQTKQIMYMRNYGAGLGLSWQTVFSTDDRAVVENHCRQSDIEFEWLGNDTGKAPASQRLRTRQIRPAIRQHPQTGETLWFNHALFFNIVGLEASVREMMLQTVAADELAFNTFYGDGTAIEPEVLAAIKAAYDQETFAFDWQAGDVLLLDNMLTCHGREPFVGPRQVLVAMADLFLSNFSR
ncbi:MAG: TauD/TfdA family dioxygenase [Cyanothece sp. SIO2G6]|nr:TauD/TfdA family dioxygenase [Cyanothece sp. SIO2G6]